MALGSLWNKYSLQNLYLQLTEYEVGRFALYERKRKRYGPRSPGSIPGRCEVCANFDELQF